MRLVAATNSVAATKIFTKILQYTRSDLSMQRVAATCCCNLSPSVYRPLRSVHTRRQVAATRWDDMSQRQIASCVLENVCENLCRCNRILLPQQVAQIQSDLIFCDLLQRQNSVAETKIFTKILQYTRSDLSLQRVASPCCCNLSPDLFTWSDLSPRRVAATCRLVCTDLYTTLYFV